MQLAHRVVTRTARDLSTLGYAVSSIVENVRSLDSELAEHCLEPAALREHDLAVIAEVAAPHASPGARPVSASNS